MIRTSVTIKDVDKGFKRLAAELGEMGSVTLGVQGKEAEEMHPKAGISVGQLAATHELGLAPGVPQRSWLRSWIDANESRMAAETRAKLQDVLAGRTTRKKALADLGYKWTAELRDNIWQGRITPALSALRIQRKGGETRPLLDTYTLMNAISYRVFLKQFKSIRDTVQRAAARGKR